MTKINLSYQSIPESVDLFYTDVCNVLYSKGLSQAQCHRTMVVLTELFDNALVHGNNYDPVKRVIVALDVNEGRVIADISDEGNNGLNKINSRPQADTDGVGGRGINLVQHYAESLEYLEINQGGLKAIVVINYEKQFCEI